MEILRDDQRVGRPGGRKGKEGILQAVDQGNVTALDGSSPLTLLLQNETLVFWECRQPSGGGARLTYVPVSQQPGVRLWKVG